MFAIGCETVRPVRQPAPTLHSEKKRERRTTSAPANYSINSTQPTQARPPSRLIWLWFATYANEKRQCAFVLFVEFG
jgi:hypothetical protein